MFEDHFKLVYLLQTRTRKYVRFNKTLSKKTKKKLSFRRGNYICSATIIYSEYTTIFVHRSCVVQCNEMGYITNTSVRDDTRNKIYHLKHQIMKK